MSAIHSAYKRLWHHAIRVVALSLFVVSIFGNAVNAAELRLLSAAAMQTVLKEIAGDFERASGHQLIISYDTIGGIDKRLRSGETYDVVIGSSLIMPALAKDGVLDARSLLDLCRTAIGAVVPSGTPKPALASVDDFKRALLDAKFVVYADPARGGAAGVHIRRQIERLGLAEPLKAKTRVAAGGDITEVTLTLGAGALGMTQVSEIVHKDGAEFVGFLPDELQNYTVFTAAVPAAGPQAGPAGSFMTFLRGPRVREVIERRGMQVGG